MNDFDDHDIEGLAKSISRFFEDEILRQHARITTLEEKTRRLEARVAQLESVLGVKKGTARSRALVESFMGIVPAEDVVGLHSESRDADGVIHRLYDLKSGRTSIATIFPGEPDAPIRLAD